MLRTRVCDLLGIEYPIVCAPMGFVTGPELAAAVSDAGGFGILQAGMRSPEALRAAIREIRARTSKPFGVNFLLPFRHQAGFDVCLEERVCAVSFFWGDASSLVDRAHAGGVKVIDQVGSVEAARRDAAHGVDLIIAQGVEAGGHIAGQLTLSALVPRVVDAVAPTPVAAAGGIADARGIVAALALGAEAAVLGTRFLATPESSAHDLYKDRVLAATEADTVYTRLFGLGWPDEPHRVLRTPFVERWLAEEHVGQEQRDDEPVVATMQLEQRTVQLQRFVGIAPSTAVSGDIESMALYAGQGVGLVNHLRPAGELVRELAAGAEQLIRDRLASIAAGDSR